MPEKSKSDFLQEVHEAQTPQRQNGSTTARQPRGSQEKLVKVTFYLTQKQISKLDELEFEYKKGNRREIKRNEIIRYLIDRCTLEDSLKGL